jgi:hypothetical protein
MKQSLVRMASAIGRSFYIGSREAHNERIKETIARD